MTPSASTPPPPLFRIRRIFSLADGAAVSSMAVHTDGDGRRQLLALGVTSRADDAPHANALVVRSVEADGRPRLWRLPIAASAAKQQAARAEPLEGLAFDPDGDWLACLSARRTRLHVVPIARLIAGRGRDQLGSAHQPAPNPEWMGPAPSAMTAPMAAYLRAANEAGGLNGARYHSRVAGDDQQMSTLEFAAGLGRVTYCRWWRCMNDRNYCLIGGSEGLISFVDVETNAEVCRCELQRAGRIARIDLVHEAFRKETRTSMLVEAVGAPDGEDAGARDGERVVRYFRVVLEKMYADAGGQDVVKTFPEHFVEDSNFRPQRIKRHSPEVRLRAFNHGGLASESSVAMYDPGNGRISVFTNFQWNLRCHHRLPDFPEAEASTIELLYASSDLVLLQATPRDSRRASVAAWISLPSRLGGPDRAPGLARIVHRLQLHGNERVVRVIQTTASRRHPSGPDEAEAVCIMQTDHSVYECRPQWSRLTLFRALRGQEVPMRDALSIGYALGIDMPSLCEVVADTICNDCTSQDAKVGPSATTIDWVVELFKESRSTPSRVIKQLTRLEGLTQAIQFGRLVLDRAKINEDGERNDLEDVALLVASLILRRQAQYGFGTGNESSLSLRPHSPQLQAELDNEDEWLTSFIQASTPRDFSVSAMVDVCLAHQQVEMAMFVALQRDNVDYALGSIVKRGFSALISESTVRALLDSTEGKNLLKRQHRSLLRSLPTATQAEFLLRDPKNLLSHREWLLRNVRELSTSHVSQMVAIIDPRQNESLRYTAPRETPHEPRNTMMSEHPASREESVELLITFLLRLNCRHNIKTSVENGSGNQEFLENTIREFATACRPPIILARTVDFDNWEAAATIHEAHGELVDALECRLHAYQMNLEASRVNSLECIQDSDSLLRAAAPVSTIMEESGPIADDGLADDLESGLVARAMEELLKLFDKFVMNPPKVERYHASESGRTAILARLLVKWFDYGLKASDLEVYLIDSTVFQQVASPLARIFFADIVDLGGGACKQAHKHPPGITSVMPEGVAPDNGLDERDAVWIRKCHQLPFSGQFLFHVCLQFLHDWPADTSNKNALILSKIVEENIGSNDMSIPYVDLKPHTATIIGKSDPLETHVKVFSCGHVFPKRLFEDDVLPQFEKRMNALSIPLFTTRNILTVEFKKSHIESPCPVCVYNKISTIILQQIQATNTSLKADMDQQHSGKSSSFFVHGHQQNSRGRYAADSLDSTHTHERIVRGQWEWK